MVCPPRNTICPQVVLYDLAPLLCPWWTESFVVVLLGPAAWLGRWWAICCLSWLAPVCRDAFNDLPYSQHFDYHLAPKQGFTLWQCHWPVPGGQSHLLWS